MMISAHQQLAKATQRFAAFESEAVAKLEKHGVHICVIDDEETLRQIERVCEQHTGQRREKLGRLLFRQFMVAKDSCRLIGALNAIAAHYCDIDDGLAYQIARAIESAFGAGTGMLKSDAEIGAAFRAKTGSRSRPKQLGLEMAAEMSGSNGEKAKRLSEHFNVPEETARGWLKKSKNIR